MLGNFACFLSFAIQKNPSEIPSVSNIWDLDQIDWINTDQNCLQACQRVSLIAYGV